MASRSRSANIFFRLFQYQGGHDENKEVRLIAASLIAAATFQAGVNPPGGVWQDNDKGHAAGKAIYASQSNNFFFVFLIANTVALSASIHVIILSLSSGFPFQSEVILAAFAMIVTYLYAIVAVIPSESMRFGFAVLAVFVPTIIRMIGLIDKEEKENNSEQSTVN